MVFPAKRPEVEGRKSAGMASRGASVAARDASAGSAHSRRECYFSQSEHEHNHSRRDVYCSRREWLVLCIVLQLINLVILNLML